MINRNQILNKEVMDLNKHCYLFVVSLHFEKPAGKIGFDFQKGMILHVGDNSHKNETT